MADVSVAAVVTNIAATGAKVLAPIDASGLVAASVENLAPKVAESGVRLPNVAVGVGPAVAVGVGTGSLPGWDKCSYP